MLKKSKLTAALLVVIMLCSAVMLPGLNGNVASLLTVSANAEDIRTGTCGDNLTWTLEDGILTISGEGDMDPYYDYIAPWDDYKSIITDAVIENGVTSIGWAAFASCASLENIDIPDSVTYIDGYAFYDCSSLKSIAMPEGITSIEWGMFCECESLTEINIPEGVTGIFGDAFSGCCNLEKITLPETLEFIEMNVFYNCNSLKDIYIPANVNSITIGDGLFAYCNNLESIVVSLENPVYDSRDNCNAIIRSETNSLIAGCKNTVIPDSVIDIESNSFVGLDKLENIYIPENIFNIQSPAFYCCSNIKSITVSPDNPTYTSNGDGNVLLMDSILILGCENSVIPDNVDVIVRGAFSGQKNLKNIVIPDSIVWIEDDAFYRANIEELTIGRNASLGNFAFSECTIDYITVSPENMYYDSRDNCNAIIDSTTNEIIKGSANTVIPDSVVGIGDFAFNYCENLESITIPDNVTDIGYGLFSGCASLREVVIPNSITSIKESMFWDCSSLESVIIPESVTLIESNAFYGCSSLKKIVIPGSVSSVGWYAFEGCDELKEIYFTGTEEDWNNIVFDQAFDFSGIDIHFNSSSCLHNNTTIVDFVAAICTEDGYTGDIYCADCNDFLTVGTTTTATGHTEVTDKAVAATCTETGLTEGKHCSVCNVVLVEQETVKALGHTEVTDNAVSATCTETGLTEGKHCSVCNVVLVEQETVNALGHTEVTDNAVSATCTETGLTEGKHCSVCNVVLVEQEIVKALGHTEATDKAVAATCTETGLTEGKHCSVCNTVLVAQEKVNATGHIDTDNDNSCDVCGKTIKDSGSDRNNSDSFFVRLLRFLQLLFKTLADFCRDLLSKGVVK